MALEPTTAIISETSPRAADWVHVFGSRSIPITSPVPHDLLGPDGVVRSFYRVDLRRMTVDQVARAAALVAERFGVTVADAQVGITGEHGLPILAEDVSVGFDVRLL